MKELTLSRIKNTQFNKLFKKIVLEESLSQVEYQKLLSIAIVLLNEKDLHVRRLGYRVIVLYCNQTNDYKPLYDISLNQGLYPIVKLIEQNEKYNHQFEDSFFRLFQSSFVENYNVNNIYLSEQQNDLQRFFTDNKSESVIVVAPTSYGKSDMIIKTINQRVQGNVCIIVPTKALISQTKRRIMEANISNINKIISHPEMYLETDENLTAVLTQERLLRLLRKKPNLKFDIVFVDEAHNLLENDSRSILLALAISVLEKRNAKINFKFLTPFLIDTTNLSVRYTEYEAESFKIEEYIKTEKIFLYDEKKSEKPKLYDQFLDDFYESDEDSFKNYKELIQMKSSLKNIIYFNKTSDLEKFSREFSNDKPEVKSERIDAACKHISDLIDGDYLLIDCLKKGIIYHHGLVPDSIRIYIEHLYSELDELKYVITSSTLLEGVNIPANRIFLLDNKKGRKKLSPAQFKNLIGRVCRFSEVFSKKNGDLKYLEPNIFLINSNYISKKANLEKFVRETMKVDKKEQDITSNVLLKNVEINSENIIDKQVADQFVENFEPGVIQDYKYSYAETKIGKLSFINNLVEIDIMEVEKEMQEKIDTIGELKINSIDQLFDYFSEVFLPFIKEGNNSKNLLRLQYSEAQNFYKMFLNWRIKSASYREMVSSFLKYWNKLESENRDTDIYVGRWGDKTKDGFRELWTDITKKTAKERVNLAIVRIKEEQDFLDNVFIKYIEVLNDLDLIDSDFYDQIKYGTKNKTKIVLMKNGLSLLATNLLVNDYKEYLTVDLEAGTVEIKPSIVQELEKNNENEILIFETKYNIKG